MSFLRSAVIFAAILLPLSAHASDLVETIDSLEDRLNARIGVAILDTRTGQFWSHRADERFLMNSTVKVPLCAAVLSRADIALTEDLPVRMSDILKYAPVTEQHVGGTMTIDDLCEATIDQSDNTAANVLFHRLGGPKELTAFLRSIGDGTTRSDRIEPELNTFSEGDERDTTTPAAMVRTLEVLLVGNGLSASAKEQLADWMRPGGVTGALLRPSAPAGWDVADKSGSGSNTRNLIAMLTPPDEAPIFFSLSISDTDADFATRNAALTELSAAVMRTVTTQD
ncbi:class A beta-lactamase [Paracoccus liaowanqingii]|uniref:Beta-lactamase n=1 Tax=Paracoccus liaowanqingii TaxID=2560053 RepID=A0A4Z1BZ91_9RHOB|nr:class A beta-lactamase [Paracoccus liaowanqingii]TGN59049.1 class A beta-lactamase [Paracoccus liaowanqingii]